jgi:S1-C subfamily serine protease
MKRILTILLLALPVLAVAEETKPAPTKPAANESPRFVPALKDGKPQGIKIYAIKPGSRFAVQGYKNGDTLTAVDGQSVNDKATEATFREVVIDGTRGGKVELLRAGKPMTLTVEVVK